MFETKAKAYKRHFESITKVDITLFKHV